MMKKLQQLGIMAAGIAVALAVIFVVDAVAPSLFERPVEIDPRKAAWIPGNPLAALDAQQRGVLSRWLDEHDAYEVIAIYYCDFEANRSSCEIGLSAGNPYLAVGDFNSDGHSDFTLILQIKRSNPLRAYLAVFNGPYQDTGKQDPVLLQEDQDFLRLGDQLFSSTKNGRTSVFFGPSDSDNGYALVPKGRTYELDYQGDGIG